MSDLDQGDEAPSPSSPPASAPPVTSATNGNGASDISDARASELAPEPEPEPEPAPPCDAPLEGGLEEADPPPTLVEVEVEVEVEDSSVPPAQGDKSLPQDASAQGDAATENVAAAEPVVEAAAVHHGDAMEDGSAGNMADHIDDLEGMKTAEGGSTTVSTDNVEVEGSRKRDREESPDGEDEPSARRRKTHEHDFERQMSLPTQYIAVIIGKGGAHINEVRKSTDVQIDVPKGSNSAETSITLSGTPENVMRAQEMLLKKLKNNDSVKRDQVDLKVEVPLNRVGAVIGRGGTRIRELIERSGARVRLIKGPVVAVCTIAGDRFSVQLAQILLSEHLDWRIPQPISEEQAEASTSSSTRSSREHDRERGGEREPRAPRPSRRDPHALPTRDRSPPHRGSRHYPPTHAVDDGRAAPRYGPPYERHDDYRRERSPPPRSSYRGGRSSDYDDPKRPAARDDPYAYEYERRGGHSPPRHGHAYPPPLEPPLPRGSSPPYPYHQRPSSSDDLYYQPPPRGGGEWYPPAPLPHPAHLHSSPPPRDRRPPLLPPPSGSDRYFRSHRPAEYAGDQAGVHGDPYPDSTQYGRHEGAPRTLLRHAPANASESFSVRAVFPWDLLPAVVGRNGDMLREIEMKSHARVKMPKRDDAVAPTHPGDQVVAIDGPSSSVAAAIELVVDRVQAMIDDQVIPGHVRLQKYEAKDIVRLPPIRLLFNRHQSAVLVGRDGADLRELMRRTGANISISPEPVARDTLVCSISGPRDPVFYALKDVLDVIHDHMMGTGPGATAPPHSARGY